MKNMTIPQKLIRVALAVAAFLLIPLFFTLTGSGVDGDGFHWTASDFVVMFIFLFVAGAAFVLITHRMQSRTNRIMAGIAVLLVTLAVWAELAVDAVSQAIDFLIS